MKSLSFVFVATFLFLTASCNPVSDSDKLELNGEIKQVVFFSDDENYRQEASYYDAIIELKKEYPAAFEDIVVISAANANKYYDLFQVNQFPAILIVHQDEVLANVNGNVTKDQIIEPLSAVLNNE